MKTVVVAVLLLGKSLFAECPDARMRSVEIGGSDISGLAMQGGKTVTGDTSLVEFWALLVKRPTTRITVGVSSSLMF